MLSNMASSLILHKRINTTLAKAKALRKYVEPLLTKSKADSTHTRRVVFSYLQNKDAVAILFRDIAVKIAERPGGYTRIIKLGNRLGDNAEMAMIELVDYNELMVKTAAPKKAKATRRKTSAPKAAVVAPEPAAEPINEAPAVEPANEAPEAPAAEEATDTTEE
jgi:large subunit ribosomal protein L17